MSGALVLVGTPIGNLGDLSPRAVEELAKADVVCCEDSRRTGRLLQHAGVRARELLVVNDHNEAQRVGEVLARLARGERVAVVTDAGMPGISDPGERLVARRRPGTVTSSRSCRARRPPSPRWSPPACPTGRFVFEGFLPRKSGARRDPPGGAGRDEPGTLVFYEAPHRLAATLADLSAVLGGWRRVAVARELTKLHEEVWRGHLHEAAAWAEEPRPGARSRWSCRGSCRGARVGCGRGGCGCGSAGCWGLGRVMLLLLWRRNWVCRSGRPTRSPTGSTRLVPRHWPVSALVPTYRACMPHSVVPSHGFLP